MSTYRTLRHVVTVIALLVVLLAGSAPAQARPLRPALPGIGEVAAFGEKLWAFFARLWQMGPKEGVLIDPNGGTNGEGMSIDPDGAASGTTDEGMSIDPNGSH